MATLFPVGGRDLVERMCNKFPELHVNDDAKQRTLTERINQQMAWTYGPKFGGKVRAGLDPVTQRSKDSQAVLEADSTVSVWDLFQGNAEATILVHDGAPPDFPNMSPDDAEFIPVTPIDWLAGGTPTPNPPPPDDDLDERVAALEVENRTQATQIGELQFQNGLQQSQLDDLLARLSTLETNALTKQMPLKAKGRTTRSVYHQHDVDLFVTVED